MEILFNNREDWRNWLAKNHAKLDEVWLIYYKKHTDMLSVKQPEAVEEALCFGWIDSIVKRIDEEKYKQKFTPRKDSSIWSDINKKRVAELIANDRMNEAGMKKIQTAKKNGMWTKIDRHTNINNIPKEFHKIILNNKALKERWDKLAPSYKKQYLYWINDAKRIFTRERRISKAVEKILEGKRSG